MSTKKIIDALNKDLALEIAATFQYLHHHWTGEGFDSPAVLELFEKISRDEMKHMEMIAERINYLGGDPTTTPAEIKKGGDLAKMMRDDLDGENMAIAQYKAHIKLFDELGDPTSRLMMEGILSDEERHADIWETTLGIKK
ncbi:MAG: ferritin-like domain-containing protein [Nitrospirae bacterium]|nr:ferritin-like domain-containing protein [Nitrospirota bacterium]